MIRIAQEKDIDAILDIHRLAFDQEDEAELVTCLIGDQSAHPILSIVYEIDGVIVGNALFTKTYVDGASAYLLAPLAVHPDYQFKGIGRKLIAAGLEELNTQNVDLVFVLGDPQYYPRSGFQTDAARLGFPPPHPLKPEWADAWMVQELCFGVIGRIKGNVKVADAISPIEYWSD